MKNPLAPIMKAIKNSTKARIAVLIVVVILVIAGAFTLFSYLSGGGGSDQASVSSINTRQLNSNTLRTNNQQYIQTLLQSQQKAAQKALKTGQTEIPSIVASKEQEGTSESFKASAQKFKGPSQQQAQAGQQTGKSSPSPNSVVNQLAQNGSISQDTAQKLKKLNSQNLSPQQYKQHLQKLVKEGKISPEQAKKLEKSYNKKHAQKSPNDLVSQMASNGNISQDTAQKLKKLNNQNLSPQQYKQRLQRLVKEGKISPEQAKKLEQSYKQHHGGKTKTTKKPGKTSPDDLVSQMASNGNISQDTAQKLKKLNNEGLSPSAYKNRLQKLVKEGKISPEQAKKLEKSYNNKHTQKSPNDLVSQMASNGNISQDTAQKLKKLNNQNLTPQQYKQRLQRLVKEGKISPEQAKKLEQSYKQHHSGQTQSTKKPGKTSPNDLVSQMAKNGNISKDTAQQLKKLNNEGLSPSAYKNRLQKLVKEGKISPEQAKKLEQSYKNKHGTGGPSASTQQQLQKLKNKNLSPSQYANRLNKLVQEGKISPEKARKLLKNYKKQHKKKQPSEQKTSKGKSPQKLHKQGNMPQHAAKELKDLSNQNTSPANYAKKLNQLVSRDTITPQAARQALNRYKTLYAKRQQNNQPQQQPQRKGAREAQQTLRKINAQQRKEEKQRLKKQEQKLKQQQKNQNQQQIQQKEQKIASAMSNQMQQLIKSWKPSDQKIAGKFAEPKSSSKSKSSSSGSNKRSGSNSNAQSGGSSNQGKQSNANKKPAIRAGDILFAVLDTGVNTDKKGPIMATIVSGKFRGAKLMGSLSVTSDHESVKLQFRRMIMPKWRHSQSINALAIDPKTAHTALASSVNHHYLVRFGSLIASSFLEGVGKAIQQSGKTTTTGNGTTKQTTNEFNATQSTLIGLGEVGKKMSSSAKKEFQRKPTVKVKAGTAMGILFMEDVILSQGVSNNKSQSNLLGGQRNLK